MMAVNFRGKVPELLDSDAGNYKSFIELLPEEFGSPGLVRNLLQSGFRRASRSPPPPPLPKGLALFRSKISLLTNWATFMEHELELRGCTQLAHLPCQRGKEMDGGCIFRPRRGELALAVSSTAFNPTKDPNSPFGEELSILY